jgi:hypothetical protein
VSGLAGHSDYDHCAKESHHPYSFAKAGKFGVNAF